MAKKITLEMLLEAKRVHGFSWTWFPVDRLPAQQSRYTGGKNIKEFHVFCGGCQKPHWVLWQELRKGRSKFCRTCAKAPTLEQMREVGLLHDALYVPLGPWTYRKGRRYIFVRCRCGTEKYISWNLFQQGLSKGCKSCRSPLRTHGLGDDPIRISWLKLMKKPKKQIIAAWRTFENFQEWAKGLYEPGWKLVRRDRSEPYGPDNCDYTPIDREKLSQLIAARTTEQPSEELLPIGSAQARPEGS